MRKYQVRVVEEGLGGAWVFRGVEAENKNKACAEAIRAYMLFVEEIPLAGPLSAVAKLEKEAA